MGAAIAGGLDRRRGQAKILASPATTISSSIEPTRRSNIPQQALVRLLLVGGQQPGQRPAHARVAGEGTAARRVDPDHVQIGVHDEHAERKRLQDHLDEPFLGVELPGTVGDHGLELGVAARVLQRDRRLVGQRHQELLFVRRELVHVAP
jgi:hypothetical protein